MQNILLFFNLEIAKATPTDIVAGKAGATVMVIKSRDLATNISGSVPSSINVGTVTRKPITATSAIAATKIIASL